MGRQATVASRTAQKWQVAGGSRANDSGSFDMPSEDERSSSTRYTHADGVSPSASSTELGRQAGAALFNKSAEELQKEKEDRARWADVESDGEEVKVFDGDYRSAAVEGRAGLGKKAKNAKAPQKNRGYKSDPGLPPAPPPRAEPPRQAAVKPPDHPKTVVGAYKPPRAEPRRNERYDQWENSAWGGHTWSNDTRGGNAWSEDAWSQKTQVKADFRKGRGSGGFQREKNESFKRGPQVTVNMDSSRLAW